MKHLELRVVLGVALIAAGGLFMLQTLGIFEGGVNLLMVVLLGVTGLFFMSVFASAPSTQWWAAIPGVILLDLTALVGLSLIFPDLECSLRLGSLALACTDLAGALFLAGIGLSFWVVYIANREQWWAVIPGGVLFTLAVVAGFGSSLEMAAGGIFFLGLGGTFLVVGLLPTPQGRMRWAFIPAAILIGLGFLVTAALTPLINYVWALALIGVGGYLLFRALRPQ